MTFGKVRNNSIAAICGLLVGLFALYFNWNGHINALFKGAPPVLWPDQIRVAANALYKEGSWGLRGGGNITGIPLLIVWFVEAAIIVSVSSFTAYGMISSTPFCEQTKLWLDETKTIDTFEAFTQPAQVEALKAYDLRPLAQAKAKLAGASEFGRLTVKHSSRCEEFCTATVANVSVSVNKEGKEKETVNELVRDITLPKSFFEFVAKLEKLAPDLTAVPPKIVDA